MQLEIDRDEAMALLNLLRVEQRDWKHELSKHPGSRFVEEKVASVDALLEKVWTLVR